MSQEVINKYGQGLSPEEVLASREKHGANIITPAERDPWWKLYLEKFEDPIIRILLIAAVVSLAVGAVHGEYLEAIGIIVAVFLATFLGFLNEYKAAKEFDILNQVSDDIPVEAIRGGEYVKIPKKDVVVGDLIVLEAGGEIPADGAVLDAVSFRVDESKLTGESMPVGKYPASPEKKKKEEGAYPRDMVLKGTLVREGNGVIRVSAVGEKTEIGKTIEAVSIDTGEKTPLTRQLDKLSQIIGVFGFLMATLIFIALVFRGVVSGELVMGSKEWTFFMGMVICGLIALAKVWVPVFMDGLELAGLKVSCPEYICDTRLSSWLIFIVSGAALFALFVFAAMHFGLIWPESAKWLPAKDWADFLRYFMLAVTIIVVAVPEGLPMAVTLSLAYSMRKMTASNNLVRRMHACETIGAATVICSDKTGTLTKNEMRVFDALFPVLPESKPTEDKDGYLVSLALAANSTANIGRSEKGELIPIGNPTEGALLFWLKDAGIDYQKLRNSFKAQELLPFSTERKFMGVKGLSEDGTGYLFVKGAPEIIMERCTTFLSLEGQISFDEPMKHRIKEELKSYQVRGMRTLGFAYILLSEQDENVKVEDLAKADLVWQGFVAIADPIRDDVPEAIGLCRKAGIDVKMVTGDVVDTAWEISRQAGLVSEDESREGRLITGPEFMALSDEEAKKAAKELKVISRARPMDKLKLVKSLQAEKEVVAVTGDGTNDGPALNQADVGLAMGQTGTAVAKEASDIILLDDSFSSIVRAVMWGRSLYSNIQRFILFQLTINVAALCIALLGPFIGVNLPFTIIQMLWINLIMDTLAALALATEPPHKDVMNQPPRGPNDFIISSSMAKNIFLTGGAFVIVFVIALLYIQKDGVSPHELTIFFSVFVLFQFWNLFNARVFGRNVSAFDRLHENPTFIGIALGIFILQIIITQFGGEFFRTVPISFYEWAVIFLVTSSVLWVGEIIRFIGRKKEAAPVQA